MVIFEAKYTMYKSGDPGSDAINIVTWRYPRLFQRSVIELIRISSLCFDYIKNPFHPSSFVTQLEGICPGEVCATSTEKMRP